MLEDVLRYINNRFDRDSKGKPHGSTEGTFSIENGTLEVDDLLEGQYFWVEGSVLNDGLHLYPDEDMEDETFTGRIVHLVIPKAVVDLAGEIEDWTMANADAIDGPYQSESFGGYSYTKASYASADGGSQTAWQAHFGPRLRHWRKLSADWI